MGKEYRCQECGGPSEYNEELMSGGLCPGCIADRMRDPTPDPYDYPNEREAYYDD